MSTETPEHRRTICNRDCPDACSIVATVSDGRVVKLQGDPTHPVTRGFLCYRTDHFLERQYAATRITQPLLRADKGGPLREVSWDEALDHAAERLLQIRAESGPAAVFHYKSGGSLGMLVHAATSRFFERFGPVTVKRGDICSGAGEAAQHVDFGESNSSDLFDLENARHILLWGKNVYTSSPHTIPVLKRAQARGAGLVLIDPVHHRSAQLCDAFVQPRPAGDYALAMAVARLLFERSWIDPAAANYCDNLEAFETLAMARSVEHWCQRADVPTAQADELARRLHDGPTTILVGWGMARRLNGGTIVRALDALATISGNVGVSGGGSSYYFKRGGAFRSRHEGLSARTICEPLFGPELLLASDPPVRALWVTAGNPVTMLPESQTTVRAIEKTEFVVVVDSFMTDTAELADLILPTTTLLEADDLIGAYGHHYIGEARPVVAAPAGVRSDLEIMQGLAERVGLAADMAGDATAWKKQLLSPDLADHDVTLDRLREREAVRNPLAATVLFEDHRFATPSGRVQLLSSPECETDDDVTAPDDCEFPLTLLSLSTPKSQSSQWAKMPPNPAEVTVHPEAAAGLASGELARLESAIGSITVRVVHDPKQRRDVAIVPKGGHLRDGSCANALIRARTTDLGEGGALYDERVRLVRAP